MVGTGDERQGRVGGVVRTGPCWRARGSQVKPRLAAAVVVALAIACVAIAAVRLTNEGSAGPAVVRASLPATPTSYLGVYEPGEPGNFPAISRFAAVTGRTPNLDGYYSGWPEPFKVTFARLADRHGATALVQMDPTDASVAAIAAGTYDDYLRAYARAVRN